MKTLTLDEFKSEVLGQGVKNHEHFAFICPMCGTVQSGVSLIRAGAGTTFDDIEKYLAFSCVGRWTGKGTPNDDLRAKGEGCNWTLGGLFSTHKLEVIHEGKAHPRFEPATPEQALALQAKHA